MEWNSLIQAEDVHYSAHTYKDFISYAIPLADSYFQLIMKASAGPSAHANGVPLICNVKPRPIQYPKESYVFYAHYDDVLLVPGVYGIYNCTTSPALPAGLTIDSTSCTIRGRSTEILSTPTTYEVYAQTPSVGEVRGRVQLTFQACEGSMLHLIRTYQSNANNEGFQVIGSSTQEVLLDVPLGHGHPEKADKHFYLCLQAEEIRIQLITTGTYWMVGSYLQVWSMLPGREETMMLQARYDAKQGNEEEFWIRRHSILPLESWYYLMGDLPDQWYSEFPSSISSSSSISSISSTSSSWEQGQSGTFPASPNQIQLYKKTFIIHDLSSIAGLLLSIRYQYACVVYLNGHEAWRQGVEGELTKNSLSTNQYEELVYRQVTLSGLFVAMDSMPAQPLLQEGLNLLAIAILAGLPTGQGTSFFDATLRLLPAHSESHLFDMDAWAWEIEGHADSAFDGYHGNTIYSKVAAPHSLTLSFHHDRREWVSSVEIQAYHKQLAELVGSFRI